MTATDRRDAQRVHVSPRQMICICTSTEQARGRFFSGCGAHDRPEPGGICHHTDAEGCTGHGDF